jgi:acetyltransferase-like isoleucine patch superfamily enzyme
VSICDGAVVGAGSVVTRDISEAGIYAGNPARLLRRLPKPPKQFEPAGAATETRPRTDER